MIERIIRAARLDPKLYEEVEADKSATGSAMLVVILGSLAAGLGSLLNAGPLGVAFVTMMALINWGLWAYMNYLIGARLLREPQTVADWGQLLRPMGFAYSPGLILVFLIVPVVPLQLFIQLVGLVWVLAAMVVAVRQALDYRSTMRAVVVTVLGSFLSALVITAFLPFLFGGG